MKTNLKVKHILDLHEFETLRPPWEKLLEQNEIDDVFLSWEWLTAWWNIYGSGKKLWLITAWENGDLAGCAPLMLLDKRIAGNDYRVLQTLGSPECDVGGFLIKNMDIQILQTLFDYILNMSSQWDVLYLKEL